MTSLLNAFCPSMLLCKKSLPVVSKRGLSNLRAFAAPLVYRGRLVPTPLALVEGPPARPASLPLATFPDSTPRV